MEVKGSMWLVHMLCEVVGLSRKGSECILGLLHTRVGRVLAYKCIIMLSKGRGLFSKLLWLEGAM